MDENSAPIPTYSELTDEQRARMDAWLAAHPYGEQDEKGIDLSTIRLNLKRTPSERLSRLQGGANSLLKIRNARRTD